MEIRLQPTKDSDNSGTPPQVKVTGTEDTITLHMEWMERRITFLRTDLEKVCDFFRGS